MSVFNKGIYERMAGDLNLTNLLSTYEGEPAIFLVHPIPSDAVYPFVTAFEDVSLAERFDSKITRGRVIDRQIRAYVRNEGTTVLLDDIIERIRRLFHRQQDNIIINNHNVIISQVFGPRSLPTDNRVIASELQVIITVERV